MKCPIQIEVVPPVHSSECKRRSISSIIEVRGAVGLDQEDFEMPRAGGRKGSVKSCVIDPDGVARIKFDSPEGQQFKPFLFEFWIPRKQD